MSGSVWRILIMTEFVSIQNENTLCKTSLFFSTNNFEGEIGRKKNKKKNRKTNIDILFGIFLGL